MQKVFTLSLALVAAVALSIAGAASARGGGNESRIKSGSCSGSATWKLKAKLDDGRIETEFEVDQNPAGRRWHVKIRRNGVLAFDGVRTTMAPSGSFEVRRRLGNAAGPDRIVAKATALATGQTLPRGCDALRSAESVRSGRLCAGSPASFPAERPR